MSLSDQNILWQAALYVRLSREDGDKEESDSIQNQRTLLTQYARQEEDIIVQDIYVDDCWTGTNFQRPQFSRMMENIRSGSVNCVIVKDLSRFGRNYIDVGYYIEKVFPMMNIRFISVVDDLDSYKKPQTMNNILVPFKNLINDEYCRDISNKVRSSLDMKRKQGKHIGSFACYGYQKDPADRSHLIIDPVAAKNVRRIFQWYLSGMSILAIAQKLNHLNLPSPAAYKKEQGLNYKNRHRELSDGKWASSSVRRILSNPMYTGTMVQGVQKVKSYKLQISRRQPEKDWIIVENTHEAIISKNEFETVQDMLKRNTRTAPHTEQLYLFSGFVRCADCGRSMVRKVHHHSYGDYIYYVCSTYTKRDKTACTKHSIRAEKLEELVLASIQKQIALAADMEQTMAAIKKNMQNRRQSSHYRLLLEQAEKEAADAEKMMLGLYPDWKSGILSKEEYLKLKAGFAAEKSEALKRAASLSEYILQEETGSNPFLDSFIQYKNIRSLNREVLTALVDSILIHENNRITIVFKYQDPFLEALDFIKNSKVSD